MKLLILDTCGATTSIVFAATVPEPKVLAAEDLPGRMASERLIVTIRELAGTIEGGMKSLEAVVVVSGPGSFTGVRVGLSAAKGLCEALDLPLIAISRLTILAGLAAGSMAAASEVFALLDAGRGEAYLGIYLDGRCLREALITRTELLGAIEEAAARTGGSSESIHLVTCEPTLAQTFAEFRPQLIAEPTAADALALALSRIQGREFDDVANIDANYLRRTDAEIFAKPSVPAVRTAQAIATAQPISATQP